MRSCAARTDGRGAGGAHAGAANWLCPPGRRMKTTRSRATCWAISGPWSDSTRASVRSIPAVTPADVQIRPCRRNTGSTRTSTVGYPSASARAYRQCVVTDNPSNSPVAANG
jgi:hypothetical protein